VSFFDELKRRNVFRVGIAYGITAWLLVQVADIMFEAIGTPAWVMQTLLVFLGLGFFVALFFAWAFELTPEGVKRENEVDRSRSITPQTGKKLNHAIVVLLVLAVAYLLYDKFAAPVPGAGDVARQVVTDDTQTGSQRAEGQAPKASRLSIAVLPFENRSNREEDQFFTDGIHDDLLTTIARIGSMKVISRTSVMEYRNTTKKIPEIARELGVANILEGGIQRSGKQVRINVQLIDARTDEHLWAEIYDRELTAENLFAIQSEISNRIAQALRTTLSPEESRRINTMPTDSLAAYDAYLRGRQLMATRKTDDLRAATEAFQTAVGLDPGFALAWVGVADSHDLLHNYVAELRGTAFIDLRRRAVERALAIDPGLGEAYTSLGMIHQDLYRATADAVELQQAEQAFKKAIELSPNYATAYQWYGNSLIEDRLRSRERLELALKASELDPRSLIIGANLANEYKAQGLFSMAEKQVKKLIELDPDFPNAYHLMVDYYLWDNTNLAKALANARKLSQIDPGNVDGWRHQLEALAEAGEDAAALAMQQKIIELDPESPLAVYADLLHALDNGNAPAAREAIQWMLPRVQGRRFLLEILGSDYLMIGDLDHARGLLLGANPGWLDREKWQNLIRTDGTGGCLVAWVLLHTGDEEIGKQLLQKALVYQEQDLPAAIEHADRYSPEICYLAQGDTDKALDSLQTQLSHRHIFGWNRWQRMPVYDPLRLNPRYLDIMKARERLIREQREAIAAMGTRADT